MNLKFHSGSLSLCFKINICALPVCHFIYRFIKKKKVKEFPRMAQHASAQIGDDRNSPVVLFSVLLALLTSISLTAW